ncbi:MAG TPA: EamA family transporter [Nitrospirae bacterium]|nr:EamA family transporter [Nitrospirota bacterium]
MLLIVFSMLLWSSIGIILKTTEIDTFLTIFLTNIISIFLFFIYLLLFNKFNILKVNHSVLVTIFIVSILASLNTITFFYSYENTTVSYAVITHYTAPFFVSVLALIFLKERINLKIILSLVTATIGMYLILNISIEDFYKQLIAGHNHTLGIVSGTASGLFYAILIIIYKKLLHNTNPIQVIIYQNLFIALIVFPFISISDNISTYLPQLFYMGIFLSTLSPILYLKGVKQVRANTAAILGYIEPLSAIILSIILLGETINFIMIIGGLMILSSGLICTLYQKNN